MSQQSVTRLKELLFEKEARDLDALAHRLEQVTERAGGDAQFRASVARVIDGAIRDAEETRHGDLADAMAPVVVRTVKSEIAAPHTQDQIAGALSPKIGAMVRSYVASAMRDMMEGINRRLEQGLTQNPLMLKIRSITTGRSMAELALADTQAIEVEEIYLIRRGSGELIRRWARGTEPTSASNTGSNRDALVSGFLTAISSFAEEAFADDKASLRSLDLDDHKIYLRASPSHLLAAKCKGTAPGDIEQVLDGELLRVLGDHQRIEAQFGGDPKARDAAHREHGRALGALAERLETLIKVRTEATKQESGGMRPLRVIAWLIALPLIGFLGWQGWLTFYTGRIQAAADQAILAMPELKGRAYGVKAQAERGGRAVWLQGLVPSADARDRLVKGIRQNLDAVSTGVHIAHDELAVLPEPANVGAQVRTELMRAAIARTGQRLQSLSGDLRSTAGRLGGDAAATLGSAENDVARATGGIGQMTLDMDDARLAVALAPMLQQLESAEARLAPLAGGAMPAIARDGPLFDRMAAQADRIAQLAIQIEQAQERVRAVAPLQAEIEELRRRLERSPREALVAWSRQNAVFFSNGVDYRNDGAARSMLDEAAALINRAGIPVRVVGFTDQAGEQAATGASRNLTLSLQRAERIVDELVRRGVPRNRLLAVGRGASEVGPPPGPANPARRVEIEPAFIGEEGAP